MFGSDSGVLSTRLKVTTGSTTMASTRRTTAALPASPPPPELLPLLPEERLPLDTRPPLPRVPGEAKRLPPPDAPCCPGREARLPGECRCTVRWTTGTQYTTRAPTPPRTMKEGHSGFP